MIGINPLFPLYIKNNSIQLGNLPLTGKYIDHPDQNLIALFKYVSNSDRTMQEILSFLKQNGLEESAGGDVIHTLINNGFFVKKTDSLNVEKNREALFFSTFKGVNTGIDTYDELSNKHVTIVGIGAIGTIILESLTRAGVSNFTLIDFDIVEKSNLQRQVLFDFDDIGKQKVNVAKEKILMINPNVKVNIEAVDILSNQFTIPKETDLIVCTADSSVKDIRQKINKLSIQEKLPVVFAGFSEYLGIIGPLIVPGKTACWECIVNNIGELYEDLNKDRIIPSFGALCNVIGSVLSVELIKYFTKIADCKIIGQELIYDIINSNITEHKWSKDPRCRICGEI